jgi:NAD(P)-dependent dehydrogenase (short-subunit alcohol dehydrogenase family)
MGSPGVFDGKVVLVFGASSGMGRATAQELGRQGAQVIVAARRGELCEEAAEGIRAAGGSARAIAVDALSDDSLDACFATIEREFGRLDGAFNNVGRTLGSSPTHDLPLERFRETLDINLLSAFRCMQRELKLMRAQGSGAIVNNSSIGGTRGFANLPDYCAAKWGLIGLTKATALENAAHGIRINVIAPGLVATERFELIRTQHAATIASRLAEVPMGRPASMDEIATAVCWLLGPGASYLTGAVMPLDGGECAG